MSFFPENLYVFQDVGSHFLGVTFAVNLVMTCWYIPGQEKED